MRWRSWGKDVATLRLMDEQEVKFVANNPGTWLFRCHNLEHMVGDPTTEVRFQQRAHPSGHGQTIGRGRRNTSP